MKQPVIARAARQMLVLLALLISNFTFAQTGKIDWSQDTISRSDAIGGRDTYVNTIRGSGQLATEMISLPVDKMKEIFDACQANGITNVTVLLVAIRQADMARFRKNNPEIQATNSQLKGRQMLVFKVPRRAFASGASSTGSILSTHPLVLSLLGCGLNLLDLSGTTIAAGDDVYFSIGTICPPPASCDL